MPPSTKGDRVGEAGTTTIGYPRLHLRCTDSTNERARMLAVGGAPHGTLVTADEQTAGRGRQGRAWVAPVGSALLCSLVLRDPPPLLSLIAGVAVCEVVEAQPIAGHTQRAHGGLARVKWPNDIVVEAAAAPQPSAADAPRSGSSQGKAPNAARLPKLAGILVEGRPQERWAVLGIGLNVAVRVERLPDEVREGAASLGLSASAIEPLLGLLMQALQRLLAGPVESVLDSWRAHDVLLGREVSWGVHGLDPPSDRGDRRAGHGRAAGIDDAGRLIVTLADGATAKLDAGEIHLRPSQ
jgi:BirA family biotin operon repressor/biotin-[acetyl-CoA-carboxylase] ligase